MPIHFSYDAERTCVYAFSTIGQKIAWMRENPKICLEVDDIGDKDHWTTVLATGRYEEIQQARPRGRGPPAGGTPLSGAAEWWFPAAAKVELTGASRYRRLSHPDRSNDRSPRLPGSDLIGYRQSVGIISHRREKFPTIHAHSAQTPGQKPDPLAYGTGSAPPRPARSEPSPLESFTPCPKPRFSSSMMKP